MCGKMICRRWKAERPESARMASIRSAGEGLDSDPVFLVLLELLGSSSLSERAMMKFVVDDNWKNSLDGKNAVFSFQMVKRKRPEMEKRKHRINFLPTSCRRKMPLNYLAYATTLSRPTEDLSETERERR